jgi:hypothetical protein
MRTLLQICVLLLGAASFGIRAEQPAPTPAPATPQAYALIVAGDGGDANFSENYRDWCARLHKLLTGNCGIPAANVRLLMEKQDLIPQIVSATSEKENVLKAYNELNAKVKSGDQFIVFFVGHGMAQDTTGRFCIPGPDLTSDETADLLNKIKTKDVIFVNTIACSAVFLEKCSAPGRIVITSTNNPGEGNETYFMEFLLRAYENGDTAKLAAQPLLNAFNTAATECPKWYLRQYYDAGTHSWRTEGKQSRELWKKYYGKLTDKKMADPLDPNADDQEPQLGEWGEQWANRRMPTEHAQLDDNGDKLGTGVFVNNQFTPLTGTEEGADGFLARKVVLGKPVGAK